MILSYPGPDRSIRLPDFHAGRVISRGTAIAESVNSSKS
jgi:hypothetical protein